MNKVGPLKNRTVKSGGRESAAGARNFLIARNSAAEEQDRGKGERVELLLFAREKNCRAGKSLIVAGNEGRGGGEFAHFPTCL